LQVENHAAGKNGRRTSIAEILACRDWIDGDFEAVGDRHDFLHLLHAVRRDRRRCDEFVRFTHERRIGIAIESYILVTRKHPLLADSLFKLLQRVGKILTAHARWKSHCTLLVYSKRECCYSERTGAITQETNGSGSSPVG